MSRIALIGNQAFSLLNFRGALIEDLVAAGAEVFAFAPDYDAAARERVQTRFTLGRMAAGFRKVWDEVITGEKQQCVD